MVLVKNHNQGQMYNAKNIQEATSEILYPLTFNAYWLVTTSAQEKLLFIFTFIYNRYFRTLESNMLLRKKLCFMY